MRTGPRPSEWAALLPLLREINDLKRVRSPELRPSIAAARFRAAARASFHAETSDSATRSGNALRFTADAVAATRLGAISLARLGEGGLDPEAAISVWRTAVLEREDALDGATLDALISAGPAEPEGADDEPEPLSGVPDWIARLVDQPRAGATAPGRPRIVLEPVESCAEHCFVTAVYAVLLARSFGADPGDAFTVGLAHHAHNARLPDAGFAGEALLGDSLEDMIARFRRATLAEMHPVAVAHVEPLLGEIESADTPLARTFHTADTIDRVLQIEYFARCNRFTLEDALVDMELVHAGPVQAFQREQLDAAGLGVS